MVMEMFSILSVNISILVVITSIVFERFTIGLGGIW